ncbi:hypothetical protein [Coleofasciculus sp. H7-2]|uniref:hypothetical protein n=1 Tax=Coleofasciculus sp. H7-2 TaxID=3351545 RepID=UPI00366E4DD6
MWSITNGIPINRLDVRQYSQRCPASAETCFRTMLGIEDTIIPLVIPLVILLVLALNDPASVR